MSGEWIWPLEWTDGYWCLELTTELSLLVVFLGH